MTIIALTCLLVVGAAAAAILGGDGVPAAVPPRNSLSVTDPKPRLEQGRQGRQAGGRLARARFARTFAYRRDPARAHATGVRGELPSSGIEGLRITDPVPPSPAPPKPKPVSKPPAQKPYALLSDAQIAGIKERLKLSSSQEFYWPAVESALRAVARKIHAARQAILPAGVLIDPDAEGSSAVEVGGDVAAVPAARGPEVRGAPARPPDRSGEGRRADLERFRAKWIPVRVKKTRQNNKLASVCVLIRTDLALIIAFSSEVASGLNPVGARKASAPASRGSRLACDLAFGDRAVAAGSFRLIERAIAPLDHHFRGLSHAESRDTDGNSDARYLFPGGTPGQARLRNTAANAFGDLGADLDRGAGKHRHQLLATIARRQIVPANVFLQDLGHQPKNLISDLMSETVVELLEVIDVDHQNAEWLAGLHRGNLRRTNKLLQRAPVGEPGEGIGVGMLLRQFQRVLSCPAPPRSR